MTTLSEAAERTMEHRWSRQKTGEDSMRKLGMVAEYLGATINILCIDTPAIRRVIKAMEDAGLAPATINRRMATLSAVLKDAHHDGLISTVPHIPHLKEPTGRERVLSEVEERRVMSWFGTHARNYLPLVEFLLNTGCRPSEAFDLTWDSVYMLDDRTMSVRFLDTKNGRNRTVPLNDKIAGVLRRLPKDSERLVFGNLTERTFRRRWGTMRHDFRMNTDEEFVPYCLRHTFATRLAARGVTLETINRLLGHSSLQMTMRYAHASNSVLLDAVEKL